MPDWSRVKDKAWVVALIIAVICYLVFAPIDYRLVFTFHDPRQVLILIILASLPFLYYFGNKSQKQFQEEMSALGLVELREKQFATYLDKSKFTYLNPKIASIALSQYYKGSFNGYQICIFNMIPPGDRIARNTALHFQFETTKLPHFTIRPGKITDKVAEVFEHGHGKIDFPHQSRFSDHYVVKGEDESAIRNILNPSAINVLSQIDSLNIESSGNELLVYQEYRTAKPHEYRAFLARTTALVTALTTSEVDPQLPSLFR